MKRNGELCAAKLWKPGAARFKETNPSCEHLLREEYNTISNEWQLNKPRPNRGGGEENSVENERRDKLLRLVEENLAKEGQEIRLEFGPDTNNPRRSGEEGATMDCKIRNEALRILRLLRVKMGKLGCKVDCRTQHMENGDLVVTLRFHSMDSISS